MTNDDLWRRVDEAIGTDPLQLRGIIAELDKDRAEQHQRAQQAEVLVGKRDSQIGQRYAQARELSERLEYAEFQIFRAREERDELREAVARVRELAEGFARTNPGAASQIIAAIDGTDGDSTPTRPTVVCLCGSTRFYDAFQQANYELTMQGKIVLSVGFYPHAKAEHGHGEGVGHDSAEKVALDELHKRKIDLADEVHVLNVGGYIGESTRGEIEYARAHGKPVAFLDGTDGES